MTKRASTRALAEAFADAAAQAENEGNHLRAALLYLRACKVLEQRLGNDRSDVSTALPRGEPSRRVPVPQFSTVIPEAAWARLARR